jgi:hypothetical protein
MAASLAAAAALWLASPAPAQAPGSAGATPAKLSLALPITPAPIADSRTGVPGVAFFPASPAALPQAQALSPQPPAPAVAPGAPSPLLSVNQDLTVINPARYQAPPTYGVPGGAAPYPIQLEPPGLERLAQSLQTDQALQERVRQELRTREPPERAVFPESPVLSTETYQGRAFEPHTLAVEPTYVVYDRLYFQQKNFERYGWDLGIVGPVVSAGLFYFDWVTWPYHLGTDPCRCMDSNAGYCLPGDPVPLMLYPPELSLTGAALEVGTILTLVAIFP